MKCFSRDGPTDIEVKVASSKMRTQFTTKVPKPCHIYDKNGQNLYPDIDQNGSVKTHTFWAAHTYIARKREYLINQMKSIRYCKVVRLSSLRILRDHRKAIEQYLCGTASCY